MVPLLAAASVAVDYANAGFEADKLQEALDSAALSAVRLYGEGQTEAEATRRRRSKPGWTSKRPTIRVHLKNGRRRITRGMHQSGVSGATGILQRRVGGRGDPRSTA
ncbi:Tad domain-containing protein [Rhizobium sp. BK538]|uniref:Tad domain-containing protein n=1 Tax=unclassified Rhizobium TaxID=2613769 RepID=UPI001FEEBA0E|nr:Tad domain-containing protein [Rhizobium sp. BK538]